jgi:hypothetical protein
MKFLGKFAFLSEKELIDVAPVLNYCNVLPKNE